MTDKKIIAVVGATGQQGGGLVRAILADPQGPFTVRALPGMPTRAWRVSSLAQGCRGGRSRPGRRGRAFAGFRGAYGAFVVTNFWAQRTPTTRRGRVPRWNPPRPHRGARPRRTPGSSTWSGPRWRTPGALRADDGSECRPSSRQLQGSALRRQGRGRLVLHRSGRADHLPADDLVLRGIRDSGRPVRTRTATGPTIPMVRNWPASRPTTSARPRSVLPSRG